MTISTRRRNKIAWQFLVCRIRDSKLKNTNINSSVTRQEIRVTAENIGVSFEEALEFAQLILKEANIR